MLNDLRFFRPSISARRTAAIAVFACASATGLFAQQNAVSASASETTSVPAASLFAANTDQPMDLARAAGLNYSSSSSATLDAVDPVAAERLNLEGVPEDATQPPPRRRYGRPRYNDSSHNPDGSSKYGFIAGAGFTLPVGNTYHYLNTSYGFQVGAGRNFNKNFSLLAQFDWDNFGFNGGTLYNQSNYYFNSQGYGLDGNSHVWSVSINPVYNIYSREGLGAYVVAGVGFYHKTANFTVPSTGEYCDPYYGCYEYQANATIDKYTSNAPGFNGGFGLTFKPSRFSSQRLYAEARYVFVDNQKRSGISPATQLTYTGNNYYPANSNRTTYIPIKFGIRF